MTIQAELADGTVLEFPDGTADAVIDRVVKRTLAEQRGPQQAPAAPVLDPAPQQLDPFSPAAMVRDAALPDTPAPTLADRVGGFAQGADRFAGVVGSGANRGIAQILGAPVEIINQAPRLINLLPGEQGVGPITDDPVGGIADFRALQDAAGLNAVPEEALEGPGERILARVGEEVGGTALPFGALLRRAQSGAQATSRVGKALEDTFVTPLRATPEKALATETALATGAGTGAGVASEVSERFGVEPGLATDLGGAVTGSVGVGAGLTLGRLIVNAIKGAASPTKALEPLTRNRVAVSLAEESSDPDNLISQLGQGQEVSESIPGFQPTAATASNDPGLQALQFSRENQANAGDFIQRRTANNQAATTAIEAEAPDVATDAALRQRLQERQAQTTGLAERGVARRQEGVEAAQQPVVPAQTRQEAGQAVREGVEAQEQALLSSRAETTAEPLRRVEASGAEVNLSSVVKAIDDKLKTTKREPVINALKSIRKKLFVAADDADVDPDDLAANPNFQALGGEAAPTQKLDTTVPGAFETRKAINDAIAGRSEDSTGRFAQKELKELRDILDLEAGKVEPALNEFLGKFREKSIPLNQLEEGATGQVLKKNKLTDTPALEASAVPRKFFRSGDGSPESIKELVDKVGDQTKAVEGVRQFALNEAKDVFDKGGDKALKKWIKDHQTALGAFPETRRSLSTLADAKEALANAERRAALLAEAGTNPRKSTIARYLDAEEAAKSMKLILQSSQPQREMRKLTRLIGNDVAALKGAKRAFFDFMTDRVRSKTEDLSQTPLLLGGEFKKLLRQHKPALKILFKDDPQQLERVERIAAAVQRGTAVGRARPSGQSGTALASRETTVPGLTVAGFTSRGFALKRGVVSLKFLVAETLLRLGKREVGRLKRDEFNNLMDRALLDPEVAKTLLIEAKEANSKVIGRRLRLHLGRDLGDVAQEDDSE